jgi:hypothetical protein
MIEIEQPTINRDNAMRFIKEVQTRLSTSSSEYKTFVAMMQKYMTRSVKTEEVVQNASVIFGDFPHLEQQFTDLLTSNEAQEPIEVDDGDDDEEEEEEEDQEVPKHEQKRAATVQVVHRGAKKAKTGTALAKKGPDTASDEALARELQAEFDSGNPGKASGKKRRGSVVPKERAAHNSGCSYVPERDQTHQYVTDASAPAPEAAEKPFELKFQVRLVIAEHLLPFPVF